MTFGYVTNECFLKVSQSAAKMVMVVFWGGVTAATKIINYFLSRNEEEIETFTDHMRFVIILCLITWLALKFFSGVAEWALSSRREK